MNNMRGLLEKDLRLLLKRKNYLLLMLVIFVGFSFMMEPSFVVGYVPVLSVLFTISTISYDEFDNGYPFLMTLPVSRKEYALSKYVFGGVLGIFAWVLAVVLYFAANVVQGLEWSTGDIAPVVLVPVTIFAVLLSVLVPVELKFGSEKGRIVLMLIFGVVALAALLGGKALAALNLDTTALVARLDAIPDAAIYGVVIGIIVSFVAVSVLISVKVMENKEF